MVSKLEWICCFFFICIAEFIGDTPSFFPIVLTALFLSFCCLGLPTFCRLTFSRHSFEPGPISLGKWSPVIGWTACVWICIITVLFVLPGAAPVTAQSMNYTVVIVVAAAIYIFGNWYFNARHWFKGPVSNIDVEEAGQDFPSSLAGADKQEIIEEEKI